MILIIISKIINYCYYLFLGHEAGDNNNINNLGRSMNINGANVQMVDNTNNNYYYYYHYEDV